MTDRPPLNGVRVLEYTPGQLSRRAVLQPMARSDARSRQQPRHRPGHVEVLSDAGVGTQVIEDLLTRKVAAAPETSRG
jgi:hypothetical protein